ncbi:MAG: hypothetical protein JWM11_1315, partial [Planctomycetaceae bacterium]|nr:hypothetical protein [Planctomycetaceae bacterium]
MAPFYLPWGYVAGMAIWLIGLGWGLIVCLRLRRSRKRQKLSLTSVNAGLSVWFICALLTLAEIWCACFVDQSDAFNMTNISKRWFQKYIEAQRNQAGFRDRREFKRVLSEGQKRICFVGDSFTIGHGLRRCEDRFSDRLEEMLEAKHPGRYQVANLADPGLETSQIVARVKAILKQGYQVDTLVYVFMLNDIEGYDPRTEQAIKQLQHIEPKFFLISQTYFLNWLYFRWRQATGPGSEYFPHLVESYSQEPWNGLKRKLDELKDECRQQKVDLRFVIFPFLHNLGPDYPFHEAHQKLVK